MKVRRPRYRNWKYPQTRSFYWGFLLGVPLLLYIYGWYTEITLGVIPRAPVSNTKAVREAVQYSLAAMNANTLEEKANATLDTILDRYMRDELPNLQLSTQETHTGTIGSERE
jgi:hypothetical protein